MWIFLNNAFVSAVEHLDDPSLLVVRARVEGDLERFLKPFYPIAADLSANGIVIERHEDRDYLFRTIISKQVFSDLMTWHVKGITYDNFKDSIADGDDERHTAYLRVWTVMNDLQNKLYGVGKYCYGRLVAPSRSKHQPVR